MNHLRQLAQNNSPALSSGRMGECYARPFAHSPTGSLGESGQVRASRANRSLAEDRGDLKARAAALAGAPDSHHQVLEPAAHPGGPPSEGVAPHIINEAPLATDAAVRCARRHSNADFREMNARAGQVVADGCRCAQMGEASAQMVAGPGGRS